MKKHYNLFLTLLGINNFNNKYYQGLTYIHFIFILLVYSPIFYNIYLVFKHSSNIHLINIIPSIKDILCYIFIYSDKDFKKYVFNFINTNIKHKLKNKIKILYIFFILFSLVISL